MNSQHCDRWQRYAVLHHQTGALPRGTHFDLLLEDRGGMRVPAGMLIAYSVNAWPAADGDVATLLPAHRAVYLQYEGPISRNRGTVQRIDAGVWRPATDADGCFGAHLHSHSGAAYRLALRPLAGDDQRFVVEGREIDTVRKTGPLG